ncbi:MAG: hypothetical protein P4M11_14735 [Candidatus Pacebacteria bacterium]|nr:hypothetical protein [Candidatus Paceibacterota bacterium]
MSDGGDVQGEDQRATRRRHPAHAAAAAATSSEIRRGTRESDGTTREAEATDVAMVESSTLGRYTTFQESD